MYSCVFLPTKFSSTMVEATHADHKRNFDASKDSMWSLSYIAWFHDDNVKVQLPCTQEGIQL